jgi:hypothetical protein
MSKEKPFYSLYSVQAANYHRETEHPDTYLEMTTHILELLLLFSF